MRASRSLWLSLAVVAAGAVKAIPASAQVVEVGGGNSSLYQAGGGSVTLHAQSYDFNIGAGTVDGHLLGGVRMVKKTEHGTYIAGDDRIDFRLPTDIFDTSHFLLVRGAGYSGVRHDVDIVAYAGASSLEYSSPIFDASKSNDPVGVLFLKKKLSPQWQLFSDTVAATSPTQIFALQWTPRPKMEIAWAAGIGAKQPFAAASLHMSRPRFDLDAAYIAAGEKFRRITVGATLFAEPDRENMTFTWHLSRISSLSASHQNFLVPDSTGVDNIHSSIDQLSGSLNLLGTQLTGTVFHSSYKQTALTQGSNNALAASATRDLGHRLHLTSSYYLSKPKGYGSTDSWVTTLAETLTSRISVNESINTSNGATSVRFGGEFDSNLLTFTANYDTFYVPVASTKPFQQALLLDVKFRLLGRLLVHGATFVDPVGRLRYTTDANTVFSHQPAAREEHVPLGRYVLHGCVMDTDGNPVEGAAVLIDEKPIYTDTTGCYYMRENKPRTHQLRVVIGEFLLGGNWQITSMPTTIKSTTEEKSLEETVTVTLRKVREISGVQDKTVSPSGGGPSKF
jgi:hypothetical protein